MEHRTFSKAFTVLFLIILFTATTASADENIYFKGKLVQDKRDGITITGEKEQGLIAITSLHFHYALILPYAEDWVFTLAEDSLLKGRSGRVNLTLSAEKSSETPEQHLKQRRKELLENKAVKGVEKMEIVEFKGMPVLREVQDGAAASGDRSFHGVKMYHFFAAKRWKEDLFVIHLSRVVAPGETFNEKQYLGMVTAGFNMDFMREGKEK